MELHSDISRRNILRKISLLLIVTMMAAQPFPAKAQTVMGLVPMWSGSVGKIVIDSVASSWGYIAISYVDTDGTCKIRCLDQFIGRDLWAKPFAVGKGMVITQMVAYKNLLAINIANSEGKEIKFAVIDCRYGKTVWKIDYSAKDVGYGNIMAYSPETYYDYVYVGLGGGRLVCRDIQHGDSVFDTKLLSPNFSGNSKLLAANQDGVVILTDRLMCFDPQSGKMKWSKSGKFYMVDELYQSKGDQQYFTVMTDGDAKYIAVIKVGTGEVLVKHKVIRNPFRQPVVLYGRLYYPFKDDVGKINLICLDIAANKILWGHAFEGLDALSWWSNDGLVASVIKNSDKTAKTSLLITSNGKESGFFDMGVCDMLVFSESSPYMTVFENVKGEYKIRSYEVTQNVWNPDEHEIRLRLNLPSAFVNGQYKALVQPLQRIDGFVCLPLRFVVENLGGTCSFDAKTAKLTCQLGQTLAEYWAGRTTARINGKWTEEDPRQAPMMVDGTMMVPVNLASFAGITIELKPSEIWQMVVKPENQSSTR